MPDYMRLGIQVCVEKDMRREYISQLTEAYLLFKYIVLGVNGPLFICKILINFLFVLICCTQ